VLLRRVDPAHLTTARAGSGTNHEEGQE
jgi:hypothetical protein